ncbi:MAG: NAD(P)/FAD-dependent oxidoreductase [Bacteroidota bacterium]
MTPSAPERPHVVVIGGGPAGLTASYELCRLGVGNTVLEKDSVVGGISRTARYKGYHFDIGGHRFFTKVGVVDEFWHEVLPAEDFLTCSRLSRIYYDKTFFFYPLKAGNALFGLGLGNSILIGLSYLRARLFPTRDERSFEDWVSNRFGRRLYHTFFKTYTEKVWGIPCDEISADWAAQRIKGLSLTSALKNAIFQQSTTKQAAEAGSKDAVIKTLIDQFEYPKQGPGMMWETVRDKVKAQGVEVAMHANADRLVMENGRIVAVEADTPDGRRTFEGTEFISTMPIRELVHALSPPPPAHILKAADALKYRDFLTVALVVDDPDLFPDNWIYIHDPEVKVGRIQNFKNWSPHMVPDASKTCLGLEYFCNEGDGLWTMDDADLVALGRAEVDRLGLANAADVIDGAVVRMPKAYPVYDGAYKEALATLQAYFDAIPNLQLVGRNGMHRYNNQDHSMLTAMLAVQNINGASYDLWKVNDDDHYHEEVGADEADVYTRELAQMNATQPRVPRSVDAAA